MTGETVDIAGVAISNEPDLIRCVEAQLAGRGPWSSKDDYTPADGLERAIDDAGPWLPVFVRVIAAHLEDDDVEKRTLAVLACDRAATAIGPEFITLTLQLNPSRFAGVKPEGHPTNQPDLRWTLLVALGRAVGPGSTDAIGLLREAALEPRGFWLLDALARVDLPWLLEHAARVVPKMALGGTLLSLSTTKQRVALVRAMGPWSESERAEALAAPVWRALPDAAAVRAAIERRLLRGIEQLDAGDSR